MATSTPRPHHRLGTFHAACWFLGLVGFVELVAVGVALALRDGTRDERPVVQRVVREYVPVAVPGPVGFAGDTPPGSAAGKAPGSGSAATETVASGTAPGIGPAPAEPPVEEPRVPAADEPASGPGRPVGTRPVLDAPPIPDPVVERLVAEARAARVRDDLRGAVVKLEEAEQMAPEDPTVLYYSAEVFETMGVYDKAADYYQKVFSLGPQAAGNLFELASHKLSHGFEESRSLEGVLALGRIRQFNDPRVRDGEKVVLTIPVVAAPGRTINPDRVDLKVRFFDKVNDEPREAGPDSVREFEWRTNPVDWKDSPEELLQVTYVIPGDATVDAHLLGGRRYCGHVVELRYGEELLDQQAWPRTLARKVNVAEQNPLIVPEEFMPEDLNELNPLLPPLPRP